MCHTCAYRWKWGNWPKPLNMPMHMSDSNWCTDQYRPWVVTWYRHDKVLIQTCILFRHESDLNLHFWFKPVKIWFIPEQIQVSIRPEWCIYPNSLYHLSQSDICLYQTWLCSSAKILLKIILNPYKFTSIKATCTSCIWFTNYKNSALKQP